METLEEQATAQALKILVVEDDAEDFFILNRMLGQLGSLKTDVMRASGIDEAIEMLKASVFDAVFVDYLLGARDGLELIHEARNLGCLCPMILLTGKGALDTDLAALRLGAADYLGKSGLNAVQLERSLRYAIERARANDALRHSEEYYRSIIANAMDLITIVDEKAVIRFESPSVGRILGYELSERMGRDLFEFVHAGDASETGRRLEIALKSPESEAEGEYRVRHKDGGWRYMEFKARVLPRHSGIRGVLFNSRDVTERKRGVETLLKVERMAFLGQMTAGMAHEVRNPVAIIRMSAEMLEESLSADPELKRRASLIVEQCERLLHVMSETLQYSRNKPAEWTRADVRELLEHALKMARIQFGSAHEKVEVVWLETEPSREIKLDRQKAELVLVNLILNAYQAMHQGGRLGLGWLASGDGMLFIVEDNGPGISDTDLDRIFDPFFTTKQQGSGLGLWLCQRMVDDSGGRLGVESGAGRGTRFTVWLPLEGAAA